MPSPPRGYSVPIVDLADHRHRQVVVDREPGQYIGHPTTALLDDGRTMLCVYPLGHGRGEIVMKRSDDGLTWSDRLPVPENWATSREVPTIFPVVDGAGVKRHVMFSGLYPIRLAVSEDDGETWSSLEPIGDFGGIVAMADLVRLHDGRYMALFHDDGRYLANEGERGVFHVYKTLSSDGGLTWDAPIAVATHESAHLCEPGAVRSPDGAEIAVLLRENSRRHNSFVAFSRDEGETWTTPRELPGALTGDRHVCRYAPDGRLLVEFRDTTHESPTKGDWVGWVGAYDDIVAGREGQYRVRLMDNKKGADCAYPAVELLPDGTFVSTTYGHWTDGESPYVVSVRFTLDELDELYARCPPAGDARGLVARGELCGEFWRQLLDCEPASGGFGQQSFAGDALLDVRACSIHSLLDARGQGVVPLPRLDDVEQRAPPKHLRIDVRALCERAEHASRNKRHRVQDRLPLLQRKASQDAVGRESLLLGRQPKLVDTSTTCRTPEVHGDRPIPHLRQACERVHQVDVGQLQMQ